MSSTYSVRIPILDLTPIRASYEPHASSSSTHTHLSAVIGAEPGKSHDPSRNGPFRLKRRNTEYLAVALAFDSPEVHFLMIHPQGVKGSEILLPPLSPFNRWHIGSKISVSEARLPAA